MTVRQPIFFALLSFSCARAETPTVSPRTALTELVRCTFDSVTPLPRPDVLEAAMRNAIRVDRAGFSLRAGQCEPTLSRATDTHCLQRLRSRWSEMLTEVQRPTADPITLDVSVHRIGEAWTFALSHCR